MNYELTDETIQYDGRTLYRIKALVDIPYHGVKAGDLGGFIEKVENLQGNAWVSGNAKVYDDAKVYDNARVSGNAKVYDDAKVFDDAWVSSNAEVFVDAEVCGNARVSGNAKVFDDAWVSGNAKVYDDAKVYDNARVYGNAWVSGNAKVFDDAWVSSNAKVCGIEPTIKEDNPHIISDQLLADLKLAACQFEQAHRGRIESTDYYGAPFIKLLRARTALEEAARAYAKQFV